jgi:transketolase
MRNAFAKQLTDTAVDDPSVVLLSGDIGNRMFDDFKRLCPGRFFNCGVAEANMLSVAAGMAMSGLRPVVYTIAPFITVRCLEQIRVDVCYHNAPVLIVGVGGGLSYASLGPTHHSCEDIAMLRVLPRMQVICPGDAWEVRSAVKAVLANPEPTYLRLGKKGEPLVHASEPEFERGRGITIRTGKDMVVLSTGNLLPLAVEAVDRLNEQGVSAGVVSLHTVKPLDCDLLTECFGSVKLVATLEEHSILGGLGGAVAEWLADQSPPQARLLRLGTEDRFLSEAGNQSHAREQFKLDADSLVASLAKAFGHAIAQH